MGYSKEEIQEYIKYAKTSVNEYGAEGLSTAYSNVALAMIQFNCMEVQCGLEQEFTKKTGGGNVKLSG